jgi:hypothetical protein
MHFSTVMRAIAFIKICSIKIFVSFQSWYHKVSVSTKFNECVYAGFEFHILVTWSNQWIEYVYIIHANLSHITHPQHTQDNMDIKTVSAKELFYIVYFICHVHPQSYWVRPIYRSSYFIIENACNQQLNWNLGFPFTYGILRPVFSMSFVTPLPLFFLWSGQQQYITVVVYLCVICTWLVVVGMWYHHFWAYVDITLNNVEQIIHMLCILL